MAAQTQTALCRFILLRYSLSLSLSLLSLIAYRLPAMFLCHEHYREWKEYNTSINRKLGYTFIALVFYTVSCIIVSR